MSGIELLRTYDARQPGAASAPAGTHIFLVDRLWPRGIAKTDLAYDEWLKDVAPSNELRKWFGHDPAKFAQFRERYRAELDAHPAAAGPILDALGRGPVRLLYSAKDTDHNQAVVLQEWLLEH